MPRSSAYDQARAVLDGAAARLGVPVHDARLLRLHSNASFALPSAGLVIRIATNPAALDRVTASIAVTRWLADQGFPRGGTCPPPIPPRPPAQRPGGCCATCTRKATHPAHSAHLTTRSRAWQAQ